MPSEGIFERISKWFWQRKASDPDLLLILDAAEGNSVDDDALADAYWRTYYGTYLPRDEWHALPRAKRASVYRIRLRLISAYAALSPDQQDRVSRMRPPRPAG